MKEEEKEKIEVVKSGINWMGTIINGTIIILLIAGLALGTEIASRIICGALAIKYTLNGIIEREYE
jgi:hypothetical protein